MEEYKEITPELIKKMKAKAQLMEDELNSEAGYELSSTGSLTGARVCEKTEEYENYVLTIQMLEERYKQYKDKE